MAWGASAWGRLKVVPSARGLQVEMAVFRIQDRLERLGAEAPSEALGCAAPQRPEDVADLVRVLESLEPLVEESPRRPGFGAAGAFWG